MREQVSVITKDKAREETGRAKRKTALLNGLDFLLLFQFKCLDPSSDLMYLFRIVKLLTSDTKEQILPNPQISFLL